MPELDNAPEKAHPFGPLSRGGWHRPVPMQASVSGLRLTSAALQPSYAKAHFRLALALQAEEKFPEAVAAFNKALQLEPKNKEAAAGLRMAEVQATRQRRQQQQ